MERSQALSQVTSLAADTPNIQYDPDADSRSRNLANEEEEGGLHKSVRIFLVDLRREDFVQVAPGGQYLRDGGPSNWVAIMRTPSLLEVIDKVRDKIPAGRTIMAIFGAIANPTPPGRIPEATQLQSDVEVEVFFDLTSAKPIRLQVVPRRDPEAVPLKADSPPAEDDDFSPGDLLHALEEYDDPGEDSNAFRRNLAGYAKRTMLRTDEGFEDRKMAARLRLKRVRVEGLDPVKEKHKEKFPNIYIIDSEDEDWKYIEAFNSQPPSGQEMMSARSAALDGSMAYDIVMDATEDHNEEVRRAAREAGFVAAAAEWEKRP